MNSFSANGKLLISGEYAVRNGSLALAVPCRFGQTLRVTQGDISQHPELFWEAFLSNGSLWFSAKIDLKNLWLNAATDSKPAKKLIEILGFIEKLNPGFFARQHRNLHCQTHLEFPLDWGLGSSSSLVSMLAQFSGTDAFELNKLSFGSSGYDIACASVHSPILYQLKNGKPEIEMVDFDPVFKKDLFFVHLNRKQDTQISISENYKNFKPTKEWLSGISDISHNMLKTRRLDEFEQLMNLHEEMISSVLGMEKVADLYFPDYRGSVKSLGAWGGDFVLITARDGFREYFIDKGFSTVLSFDEMVLNR
ncbi:MAG: GYDIA family GHMP kinase [Weeksellaceae bacterium]|nr:GYDIA family GHMP kinase [Weeksellaceae bacterium]